MRKDPLGVARVRRGLGLSRPDMGKLLGVGEDPLSAEAAVRSMENGEQPISPTVSRLLASLEVAMPGDPQMHPRFLVGDTQTQPDQFLIHTRYPRFFGRIVPVGTPVAELTQAPLNEADKLVVYLWQDDPQTVSGEAMRALMEEAKTFFIQYMQRYERMSADENPWDAAGLIF